MSNTDPGEPILYVKVGCGWCQEVMEFLDERQMPYRKVVVSGNPEALREMVELSGQSRAPTVLWDGEVLADFGVDELVEFLQEKGLA
ncbi:MAG: glutaredoxin family protein [Limisphaerales bacterium]